MKVRSKAPILDAIQWTGKGIMEIILPSRDKLILNPGDWLIKDDDKFHMSKENDFIRDFEIMEG